MTLIADRLTQVTLGQPQQYRNLTLYPLLAEGRAEPGYQLLDQALALGSARVTEVSEGGSVPELCFVNDGDLPVLLLDGEELVGAKQNRILNLTVLAPAHQTLIIPVSCVEAGRWHRRSAEFTGARRAHFAAGRARKAADVSESLRRRGTRESDQGRVWGDIAEKSRRFGIHSATGAAAALYESQRERLDDFQGAFAYQPGQCGALFGIAGRLVGLDLFDSPATLAAALPKLVESHALDAIDATVAGGVGSVGPAAISPDTAPADSADPAAWLTAIAQAAVDRFPAVGEGEDWRLRGLALTGGALVKDDNVIHLCAFRIAWDDDPEDGDKGDEDELFGPEGDEVRPAYGAVSSAHEPEFRLDLATDRRRIRAAGLSRRYLHLRLTAPRGTRERAPLDLALVLDRSGSMGGGKWLRAKEAALAAIGRLTAGDRITLVAFDQQIDTPLPLMPATAAARRQAATALEALRPRGQTNLGEAWLTASALIGRDGGSERLRRCLVLTDGQANVGITDPAALAGHAANLLQLGVRTSTFGLGDDYNEELLGQLADAGGGAFHDIIGAEGIQSALDRELGDALEVVCAELRVYLSWQADLQVRVLGTWGSQAGPRSLTILPGDLVSEQILDLLVEVHFPAGPADSDCLIQVQVSDGDRPLAAGDFRWTWVDSTRRKAQPRDAGVERRVAAFLAYQARREAAARNRDGDLDGARERLRQAAADLHHYSGQDAEVCALAEDLETEVENHRARLSQRDIKRRIYQSSSAMKGRKLDGGRTRTFDPPEILAGEGRLHCLNPLDSPAHAARIQHLRQLPRHQAAALAKATMNALVAGTYVDAAGRLVDWKDAVQTAMALKRSLPPDASLSLSARPPLAAAQPTPGPASPLATRVQVVNDSTLAAAQYLAARVGRVLALVFGNGIEPGGGFLVGNRGQESVLCRSSAPYATLQGDAMYAAHLARPEPDSTDWAILSPDVPVYRDDEGRPLDQPWLLSFITVAAPYAPRLGISRSTHLMESRIRRVLAIARAYGYQDLILGAWGCGTYGNNPRRIATLFRAALEEQAGVFREVVFAIADWSPERQFLGPFAVQFRPGELE